MSRPLIMTVEVSSDMLFWLNEHSRIDDKRCSREGGEGLKVASKEARCNVIAGGRLSRASPVKKCQFTLEHANDFFDSVITQQAFLHQFLRAIPVRSKRQAVSRLEMPQTNNIVHRTNVTL